MKNEFRIPKSLLPYIPFIIFTFLYLFMRAIAMGGLAPINKHTELGMYEYIINIFPLFVQYLQKLLLPINLNAYHIFRPIHSIMGLKGITTSIIAFLFLLSLVVTFKKNKGIFMSLLFIVIPILPVLYIPGLSFNVFTERYLYLSVLGFVLLLILFINWISLKKPELIKLLNISLFLLILLYSIGTIDRNSVWKDDLSLSSDMAKKSPDDAIVQFYYGSALLSRGDLDKALEHFNYALKLNPPSKKALADTHVNIGHIYLKKGLLITAKEQIEIALSIDPENSDAYAHLAQIYRDMGLLDAAIEYYKAALEIDKSLVEVHNSLAIIYAERGLIDEAIKHFEEAVKINPDDYRYRKNLEKAYNAKFGVRS